MPSSPTVSLRDIARKAGVSVSAVSLALRNSAKVSAQRRDDIQRIAAELGYQGDTRVSELMQHLRKPRTYRRHSTIAILVPELSREQTRAHPRLRKLIAGVSEFARSVGFEIDHVFLNAPGMSSQRARSIIRDRGIKGVVVMPFASGVARLNFDFTGLSVATAGYSIVEPKLHRACPDFLKMMDEILARCTSAGYERIGLAMTKTGGTGFKLFTSSFLYFQSTLPRAHRVPMLGSPIRRTWHEAGADPENVRTWITQCRPEVVIGTAQLLKTIQALGLAVPDDIGFVSIDVSEEPVDAAGANHCFEMVGQEAFKLMLTSLNLGLTGVPEHPRVVLVDSHQQDGFTLCPRARHPK